ncbi:MAG: G/U mismatch-specific DNA glycosylase [Planctomycetota bacterium]
MAKRIPKEELEKYENKLVPDLVGPNMRVLFCGINPGLETAYRKRHFAGPSNRFYPTLHAAGFVPEPITAQDQDVLLANGLGITNVVQRATRSAADLTADEVRAGATELEKRVKKYAPAWLAVLGIGTYRTGWSKPKAAVGHQPDHRIGDTRVWVLPNPSGLNAHYKPADFARLFGELREASSR